MTQVTRILSQIASGDPLAAEQLLPLVYDELRKLAAAKLVHEKPGHTLQATELVHDAYLRLVDVGHPQNWDSRGHFFSAAAEAMRRILIESARRKSRVKHGGGKVRLDLDRVDILFAVPPEELLALDEALSKLAAEDPVKAKLVELRFFVGLQNEEAADLLGISAVTAKRYSRYARAWLHREIADDDSSTRLESQISGKS